MRQLHILQDQLEYVGLLAAPAFRLFAAPAGLASGVYHAFSGYHAGAEAIRFEGDPGQPHRQVCIVELGAHGTYRLSLERVEWTLPGAGGWGLDTQVLGPGDAWLRSLRSGAPLMHSHYFTYSAHGSAASGTARDVLLGLGGPSLPGFGDSEGTGLIFHTRAAAGQPQIQFTIDHSHEFENGLFIELIVVFEQDVIDFAQSGPSLAGLLRQALLGLGIETVGAVG